MAKKEKIELTPEERLAKEERKKAKRKVFGETFLKACALFLAVVFVYSVTYVAFGKGRTVYQGVQINAGTVAVGANSGSAGGSSAGGSTASGSTDTGAAQTPEQADQAAEAANAINAATAAGVNAASYKWERHCTIDNINVGDKTEDINGIIHRIDSNADLNSVVGGFLGKGDKDNTYTKGADAKETFGNANYALIATSLQPGDLQGLKVEGNTYTFTLPNASNPQKDQSQALSRLTNDFITQQEVADGIKDALGALSFLLSVKSADAEFNDIQVKVVIKDGKLETLHYSYHMDVKSLALSVATGTGNGDIEATYSNFVY